MHGRLSGLFHVWCGNFVETSGSTSCAPVVPMLMLLLQVKRRVEAKNGLENYAFQVRNSLRDEKVSTAAYSVVLPPSGLLGWAWGERDCATACVARRRASITHCTAPWLWASCVNVLSKPCRTFMGQQHVLSACLSTEVVTLRRLGQGWHFAQLLHFRVSFRGLWLHANPQCSSHAVGSPALCLWSLPQGSTCSSWPASTWAGAGART